MKGKVKNYVLDTNILIHCPEAIFKFEDNNVYITHTTMEELDGLKGVPGEVGYNARESIRQIHSLRQKGKLLDGVPTPGGGKFFVFPPYSVTHKLPDGWRTDKADNQILLNVLEIIKKDRENTFLVTNDISLMLKADILGIPVQNYKNDRVPDEKEMYTGRRKIAISKEAVETFDRHGKFPLSMLSDLVDALEINEFLVLTYQEYKWLAYFDGEYICKLKYAHEKPFGVSPRNAGQFFAQEALMKSADEVPLVILKGPAGTSKTFYCLACGLEQVVERGLYKRVLICRPNVKFDDDIGYLKGTEMDKIMPLLRPSLDNLEALMTIKHKELGRNQKELQSTIEEFFDRGWVTAEALAYLRGRSITDTFIIIDEAQNATPNQILGIITRAGKGSKICIIGDLEQIDTPRLDKYNNGLAHASEKMKGSELVMQMTFTDEECTRSELSKEAAERLAR